MKLRILLAVIVLGFFANSSWANIVTVCNEDGDCEQVIVFDNYNGNNNNTTTIVVNPGG